LGEKIKTLQERKAKYQALKAGMQESGAKQVSLTDKDARAMVTHHNSTDVCYNVQTAVDEQHQLIVEHEVTNDPTDHAHLAEMAVRAKEMLQVEELEVVEEARPARKPVPAKKPVKPALRKPPRNDDDVIEDPEVVEEVAEIEEVEERRPAKRAPVKKVARRRDEDDEEVADLGDFEDDEDEDEDDDDDEEEEERRPRGRRDRRRRDRRKGGIPHLVPAICYSVLGIVIVVIPFVLQAALSSYEAPTFAKIAAPIIGVGVLGWGVFHFFKK